MRHVPSTTGKWHGATDSLRGTAKYGDPDDHETAWSVRFDNVQFNQFLFVTGDCKKWLIASPESVHGKYSNASRTIIKSSISPSKSYKAKWYNRTGTKEDPWISLNDHHSAIGDDNLLYGEAHFRKPSHTRVLKKHGGADVYIRFVSTDAKTKLNTSAVGVVVHPRPYLKLNPVTTDHSPPSWLDARSLTHSSLIHSFTHSLTHSLHQGQKNTNI